MLIHLRVFFFFLLFWDWNRLFPKRLWTPRLLHPNDADLEGMRPTFPHETDKKKSWETATPSPLQKFLDIYIYIYIYIYTFNKYTIFPNSKGTTCCRNNTSVSRHNMVVKKDLYYNTGLKGKQDKDTASIHRKLILCVENVTTYRKVNSLGKKR